MKSDSVFYQLFEPITSTYTYIVGDATSKEVAIIDPVRETVTRDIQLINELGLKLKYVLETHIHADHVTSASTLREEFGAQTALSEVAGVECSDIPLKDGDVLELGSKAIKVLTTPGHTNTCLSYLFEDSVFTGDALLIRGTGRTDFQQGDSKELFESIRDKLFALDDQTFVYPGHDYKGRTKSTIGQEKEFNPRVGMDKSLQDFVKIMDELDLPNPKQIHEAVPANLVCGRVQKAPLISFELVDQVPTTTPENLDEHKSKVRVVDVRTPEEFTGELGHVPGSQLVTLGDDLDQWLKTADKSDEIVFVCRSGARSANATLMSQDLGFKHVYNMEGGMILWNQKGLKTE